MNQRHACTPRQGNPGGGHSKPTVAPKRLRLSFAFAGVGSAGTHRGESKGPLPLQYPNVPGKRLTAKSRDVAFFQRRATNNIAALVAQSGDA